MPNVNDSCLGSQYPSMETRLFVGLPVFFLSTVSAVLNISLLRILLLRSSFLESNFRRHIISLVIASLGFVSVNYYCFLPIALFGVVIHDPWLIILASPNSFFFQAILFANSAIALDRFLSFCIAEVHRKLMLNRYLRYSLLLLPWAVATLIVAHSTVLGYYKRVNPYSLNYTYDCSTWDFYEVLLFYLGFILPALMFFLYMSVFTKILAAKSSAGIKMSSGQKTEMRFIAQFTIISLLQLFGQSFFYLAPTVMGRNKWTGLLMTFFSTLNCMSNPIVMLLFQARIRKAFIALVKGGFIFMKDFHPSEMARVSVIEKSRTRRS